MLTTGPIDVGNDGWTIHIYGIDTAQLLLLMTWS